MLLPFVEQQSLYNVINPAQGGSWHHENANFGKVTVSGFLCPSTDRSNQVASGYPGNHYAFSSGCSIHSHFNGAPDSQNGMINPVTGWSAKDVTDGFSKTILAAEFLSGKGPGGGSGIYPFDLFAVGNSLEVQGGISARSCPPAPWPGTGPRRPATRLGPMVDIGAVAFPTRRCSTRSRRRIGSIRP